MTLLVAVRAMDGIVALSDRKETVGESGYKEVTKYYLDSEGSCYLALSGDAAVASRILDRFARHKISAAGIFTTIEGLAITSYTENWGLDPVVGNLIVADNGKLEMYQVSIASGIAAFPPRNMAVLAAEGDYGATSTCRTIARGMPFSDMPCENVARYLHTLASLIGKTVRSVGERGKYGIDMVVFAENGTVTQLQRRTDKMGALEVHFKAHDAGPLLASGGGA